MSMIGESFFKRTLILACGIGGLGLLLSLALWNRANMISYSVGFGLSLLNLWSLKKIGSWLLSSSKTRAMILIVLKFFFLIASVFVALCFFRLEPLGLLVGLSVTVISICAASFFVQGSEREEIDG